MKIEDKIDIVREVGKEIITEDELSLVLKDGCIAYDGFEPSGTNIHIAQGLLRSININKMIKAGCNFKILIADWHAWANNKMEGNLEHIQKVGQYLVEVWKACDMDQSKVKFIWASDLVKNDKYWKLVMEIARLSTVKRIIRCGQIMGRGENEVLQASQILYPCMQCADIFYLDAKITQLGMDQRKVNVLARELASKLGYDKPIVVSHHMLMGLGQPPKSDLKGVERGIEMKMSKSKPDTAIFMNDSKDEITRKLKKAYCPEGEIHENPVLEYCKYILFEKFDKITISREKKWGGDIEFHSYEELEKKYGAKEVHPMDLKIAVAKYLNDSLKPIRLKLEKNKTAMKLIKEISGFKVTR